MKKFIIALLVIIMAVPLFGQAYKKASDLPALIAPGDSLIVVVVDWSGGIKTTNKWWWADIVNTMRDSMKVMPFVAVLTDSVEKYLAYDAISDSVMLNFNYPQLTDSVEIYIVGTNNRFTVNNTIYMLGDSLYNKSTTSGKPIIYLENDNDDSYAPAIYFIKDSDSPATDDNVGNILFFGKNDAAEDVAYHQWDMQIGNPSDGSEDGYFEFYSMLDGTLRSLLKYDGANNQFEINDGNEDIDFFVKYDNGTAISVDGGTGITSMNSVSVGDDDFVGLDSDKGRFTFKNEPNDSIYVEDASLKVFGNLDATAYGSDGSVSDAELLYINTLSSNAQDQLNDKVNIADSTGQAEGSYRSGKAVDDSLSAHWTQILSNQTTSGDALPKTAYGDSLVNYDGDGLKITDLDAIEVLVDVHGGLEIVDDSLNIKDGKVTNAMLAGSIDLASKVTGTLPEANGGTGDTDLDDIIGGDGLKSTDGANAIIGGNATLEVLVDYDGGLEIGDDSLNVKLDGATLTKSSSGLKVTDNTYQPLESTLTDIADGTIAENLVNTDNPWADNEVADDITATNYLLLTAFGDSLANHNMNDSSWVDITSDSLIYADHIKANSGDGLLLTEDGGGGIFIADGGQVGIGTTSPKTLLHVGEGSDNPGLGTTNTYLYVARDGYAALELRDCANNVDMGFGAWGDHGFFGTRTAHPIKFQTNGFNYVFLHTDGNFGVGRNAATPQTALDVHPLLGDTLFSVWNDNDGSGLTSADSIAIVALGDGKVGIGTNAPAHKLHLVGNIALGDTTTGDVDGIIYFGDDGNVAAESIKWDDGDDRFELSNTIRVESGDIKIANGSLDIDRSFTNVISANNNILDIYIQHAPSGAQGTYATRGLMVQLDEAGSNNRTGTIPLRGIQSQAGIASGSSGNVSGAAGFLCNVAHGGSGTLTDAYGGYIFNPPGAGTITNNYGLYIENQTRGTSLNYAIYTAGGINHFQENITTAGTVDGRDLSDDEWIEDEVGQMLGGTETLISVDYQDGTNDIDFVVDNDLSHYDNTTSAFITGNQTITLSGDVMGSGTTSISTTIGAEQLEESMLKAVNAAVDEDIMTYESTTGDFEWHTPSELITAGTLIDWTGATLNVDNDLHNYSWASVDATDLKTGSVTQAYDADLTDLADRSFSEDFTFEKDVTIQGTLQAGTTINVDTLQGPGSIAIKCDTTNNGTGDIFLKEGEETRLQMHNNSHWSMWNVSSTNVRFKVNGAGSYEAAGDGIYEVLQLRNGYDFGTSTIDGISLGFWLQGATNDTTKYGKIDLTCDSGTAAFGGVSGMHFYSMTGSALKRSFGARNGHFFVGDSLSADTDRYLYFATDGSFSQEYIKYDEDDDLFEFSGGIKITANTTTASDLNIRRQVSEFADDGFIQLGNGLAGWGEIMVGDNEEWAHFRFSSDGTVTLIDNTSNVVNTNTDGKFCVFDNGSTIMIINKLGSAKDVAMNINYYTP